MANKDNTPLMVSSKTLLIIFIAIAVISAFAAIMVNDYLHSDAYLSAHGDPWLANREKYGMTTAEDNFNAAVKNNNSSVEVGSSGIVPEQPVSLRNDYAGLPEANVYYYADIDEIIAMLEHGTGVVAFGYPECPWCQEYLPMFDELAWNAKVRKVPYYDVYKARTEYPDEYARLLDVLRKSGLTKYTADGEERVFVPLVVFVDGGKVVFSDNETSDLVGDEQSAAVYWTDDARTAFKEKMLPQLEEIAKKSEECGDCS